MFPLSSAKTSRVGKSPSSFPGDLRSIRIHSRLRNSAGSERWSGLSTTRAKHARPPLERRGSRRFPVQTMSSFVTTTSPRGTS